MAETRPTGEQLRFLSANTGEHVLDTYMEAAEIGGRTLSDLLDDLFDPANSGTFRSENFEFRYNATTSNLQFRAGVFSNSSASFVDVTSFFSVEGAFSTSTSYNNFDLVTVANSDVYLVHGLSSASTFGSESAFISSSNTKKIVDVSGAQAQAAIASDHRADAAKYAVTAEDTSFSLTSTNGGTSGLFSALHYQAKASANATTATTQAGLASNHRADAAKYAVTAHNQTFSLTSTNGGTSGLYSALHYATEASNSASSASGHKDTASNHATAPTTTLSSGSAKAWALGGGSSFTISTAISGSDFSSKYYANQSNTHATTALGHANTANTHKNTASDHKDDAGKYAVTAHNTTFTLTSTNGGTSGLYSALHYATEAANSATAAQNTANAIGNLNSLSDVTISSIANNQFIQYNNSLSKFVNVTKSPIITLTGDVTGTGTLTNLGDVSFETTIADDSHNHTISNIDTLSTVLASKSTESKTETLTNKTFDVEASGNSISNIDVADFKSGVLDTNLNSVSGSDDTLASAKSIVTQLNLKATVTALNLKAPLASPSLTGTPTAPTAASNTNTTQIATTAYVQTELSDLVDSAPGTLNTLNELAAALGDDANFSTTVTNSIATKMPLAGGTFTGDVIFDSTNSSAYDLTWDSSEGKLRFNDSARIELGTDGDAFLKANHVGTSFYAESMFLLITNTREDGDIKLSSDDGSGGTATYIQCDGGTGEVKLNHYGSEKLVTKSTGLDITGVLTTTGNIELGHASDTTISRASAGVVNINSNAILTTATGSTSDDVTALAIALG